MEYHKGKYNTVPDALSKAPVNDYHSQPATCAVVLWFKRETTRNLQVMDMDIWKAQQEDPDVQSLYEKIMETGEVMVKPTTKYTVLGDKVYRVITLPQNSLPNLCSTGPL